MQAVQELAAYAKNHGLFRAASACDVTCSLLSLMFPCGSCCAGSIAGSSSRFQFLRKAPGLAKSVELWGCGGCGIGCEGKLCSSSSFLVLVKRLKKWMYFVAILMREIHVKFERCFVIFSTLRQRAPLLACCCMHCNQLAHKVSTVELFISHSSKCPSWQKLLALCHYLNLDLAIFSSFLACISGVIFLVLRAGSLSAVAQEPQRLLSGSLFWWPMLAFVMTFFCGHLLSNKLLWFDRLCIDQENLLRRCQALKAVPAFVAHSERMIILLDETYFSRLWCVYVPFGFGLAEVLLLVVSFPICFLGGLGTSVPLCS